MSGKRTARILFAAWSSLILLSSMAYSQNGGLKFTLADLGVGYGQSEAFAINNSGQIVGDYTRGGRNPGQFCFSKLPGQAAVLFGTSPCSARAVNSNGFIAGWMNFPGGTHAFRRDPAGTMTELPPASQTISHGYGIDDSLDVVGDEGVGYNALRWDIRNAGTPTILDCPSSTNAAAYATSSSGFFVAGVCNGEAATWVNTGRVALANLGCTGSNAAHALNANVHSVGLTTDANCAGHAALWDQNWSVVDLGYGAVALGISSDDWIVGGYFAGGAFLRVSDPVCPLMVNLNLLLDSSGAGWSVTQGYGINDSHQIVGQGLAPNGQYHAILLTPANNSPLCKPD